MISCVTIVIYVRDEEHMDSIKNVLSVTFQRVSACAPPHTLTDGLIHDTDTLFLQGLWGLKPGDFATLERAMAAHPVLRKFIAGLFKDCFSSRAYRAFLTSLRRGASS